LIDVELDRQSMEQLKPHCEQLAKYACASSGGLHLPSQWSERIRYVVGTKSFSCEEVTKIHSCEDIDWKNW